MAKIYQDFQELVNDYKSIFKLLEKNEKMPGIYRAIWDARQSEIDSFKDTLFTTERNITKTSGRDGLL